MLELKTRSMRAVSFFFVSSVGFQLYAPTFCQSPTLNRTSVAEDSQEFDKSRWAKYESRLSMVAAVRKIITKRLSRAQVQELLGTPYPVDGGKDLDRYILELPAHHEHALIHKAVEPVLDVHYVHEHVRSTSVDSCTVKTGTLPPGLPFGD